MFGERFIFDNPDLEQYINDTENPEDDQLEQLSSRLAFFAKEVRRYSVFLDQKSTWEIYLTTTVHADPHIALVLAAADNNGGTPQFPSEESIKQVLYGIDIQQQFSNNKLLADGVRRVSIALSASILIGQLSQIPEQFQHANGIKKQALEDLDRIVALPELKDSKSTKADELEGTNSTFYFTRKAIPLSIGDTLTAEIYVPSIATESSEWKLVNSYDETDEVTTAKIVADIADKVNEMTLVNKSFNLLASPSLSGPLSTHFIKFYPREILNYVQAESISIRFKYYKDTEGTLLETLPFDWGVELEFLSSYPLNSIIILSDPKTGSTETKGVNEEDKEIQNTVYFRNDPNVTISDHIIEFKINPTDQEVRQVSISNILDPKKRAGAAVFALAQELSQRQNTTRILGPIVRNDNESVNQPISAFSILSFALTYPETFIVLDILKLPKDLEIALGSSIRAFTSFSSRPKSLRVESVINTTASKRVSSLSKAKSFGVTRMPNSKTLQNIKDETRLINGWDYESFN